MYIYITSYFQLVYTCYSLYNTNVLFVIDAGEIQGQVEWPGSLVESGPQEQRNAERSRHCEGLLEEGKLPEFQFPMKLKDLEFHAVFLQVLVFSKKLENKGYYFLYGRFQNNLLITEQKSCENS